MGGSEDLTSRTHYMGGSSRDIASRRRLNDNQDDSTIARNEEGEIKSNECDRMDHACEAKSLRMIVKNADVVVRKYEENTGVITTPSMGTVMKAKNTQDCEVIVGNSNNENECVYNKKGW